MPGTIPHYPQTGARHGPVATFITSGNRQVRAGSYDLVTGNAVLVHYNFFCSGGRMFEVYLSDRRDLLVVKKGSPLPPIAGSGKWRRKKKVLRVSNEIRSAVQRHGYYVRKLSDAKNGGLRPDGLAQSFGNVQQSLQHHY